MKITQYQLTVFIDKEMMAILEKSENIELKLVILTFSTELSVELIKLNDYYLNSRKIETHD